MANFSIILPCFNEVSNIGKLIAQIRNSGLSPKDCQIIVVDDCSSDGTTQLLSMLASPGSGIEHIIPKARVGLAASIRIGIEKSEADYIAVMDSDGMHDPSYLPKMFEISRDNRSLVIGSRFAPGGSSHGNVYPHVSRLVNVMIQKILDSQVKDQLCGFFVCDRESLLQVDKHFFTGFGEYFIAVVHHFEVQGSSIIEMGTIHKVRDGGLRKSKRIRMFFNYLMYSLRVRS